MNSGEGLLKKRLVKMLVLSNVTANLEQDVEYESKRVAQILDEARADFLKGFTGEDFMVLQEYGLSDDSKLTVGAIELKHEILEKWGRQSVPAFLKWLGSGKETTDPCECSRCHQDYSACMCGEIERPSEEKK